MRLMWDNKADGPTMTAKTEATNYPVSNLLDWQAAKCFRTQTDTDEWISWNAGAGNNITATTLGVVNHNWGANGTFNLQANTVNVWTAPPFNETITPVSGIITQSFNSSSYQWWRIYMHEPANPDDYLKIGYFFLGDYYQFTNSPGKDFPLAYDDTSTRWSSKTGQEFINDGVVNRRWSFQWPWVTNNDRLAIEAIYTSAKQSRAMVVVPDENNLSAMPPRFMRFSEPPAWNHIIAYNWNLTLSFKEQL